MADNRCAPSFFSQNSMSASFENQSMRFPIMVSNTPTTTTNLLMPTLALAQPSSGRVVVDLTQDPREGHTAPPLKKPRGRPKGSKNKPKPVPIVVEDNDNILMEPLLIEVPIGKDVLETLLNLARCHQAGITVLSGFGSISEVTLLNPITCVPAFPLKGMFNMTSLSGTYINASGVYVPPRFMKTNPTYSSFSVILSSNQGKVFGGIIGGKIIAAGGVSIIATLFKKPAFHRMGVVNGNVREIMEDEPIHAGGVIINFDRRAQ